MSVGKLRISSHLSEEIAGRQQHSEEDQAADERQRVAPQHALAGLVKAVVIGVPVMARNSSGNCRCRASELAPSRSLAACQSVDIGGGQGFTADPPITAFHLLD